MRAGGALTRITAWRWDGLRRLTLGQQPVD
jgi:hypothetical protein